MIPSARLAPSAPSAPAMIPSARLALFALVGLFSGSFGAAASVAHRAPTDAPLTVLASPIRLPVITIHGTADLRVR